ncbi:fimbrial biogenesis chaperone [Roseinatronobacter bogoriensis]|uniref:Molecular chaperone n=1 Tax=Roseinatronobacter bogoriensis subsp. barguzinensis TaxID=441209 RepID=A0A2K8KCQ2_9RHOB|nr:MULTISPECIES: molecular chaperone [Rhodobaca]ATX64548.1 molecular chaperone [Rhodobaca barguzinensis]MBB4209728.1 fimbrial chaperone protein [Rhodobaca bogoriensis DSM 18756]TDW33720.1 fimbrial chaperone protein [Rhodobaca barguzinensis]TDY66191.1 fimbrial chaperone protein [Rhodobaca bogoriensis DSM 18756]
MKRIEAVLYSIVCVALLIPALARADGLRVSPVTLAVTAPGAATTLTLRNDGRDLKTVQARVFRWTEHNGRERMEVTNDVVVSPPMTQLRPGAEQTLRVVRTSTAPVRGEEAYRIYIDEVPDRTRLQAGQVAFVTRLRIPAFFTDPRATPPQVGFSLVRSGGTTFLEARNTGDVRLRLGNVRLTRGNNVIVRRDGLMGYALGNSTMRWPVGAASQIGNANVNLAASTSLGTLNAPVSSR